MHSTDYYHRQFGLPALISFLVLSILLFSFPVISLWRAWPAVPVLQLAVLTAGFIGIALIHYHYAWLTIQINQSELSWFFGVGLWRKRLPLSEIAAVSLTHVPWWYGVGAKWTPAHDTYLIAPGTAVQIERREGKIIRLCTDDPAGLMLALTGK